jgi:hypothetical protein
LHADFVSRKDLLQEEREGTEKKRRRGLTQRRRDAEEGNYEWERDETMKNRKA